ncbi:MAG: protoporphyrinogen oxidase [Acidobacteria bacterium]|nr:protoporphyrinogen oxidase [Acidobacteriota bacterium]
MKIAIIGGGIAGLSAAWELEKRRRAGLQVEYRVFERNAELGGVIRTRRLSDGSLFEEGPDSFLTEKPWAADLCRELGLADELIGSNDAARRTFILLRDRLRPLPDGLQFFVPTRILPVAGSALFSFRTKLRFAREYVAPPAPLGGGDESVAAFVARHFGHEVVETLADPLLGGIYGGSADQLSVRAVLPRMVTMESQSGSLIRAMLRARRNLRTPPGRPLFTALRRGMQQMTDALAAQLNASWVHRGVAVSSVGRDGENWLVGAASGPQSFDAIIMAVPAWASANLLRSVSPGLSAGLASIPYSSSAIVNLAFDAARIGQSPEGFGFLVPRSEGRAMLACTFVQNKFPHRAAPGMALYRCFFAAPEDEGRLLGMNDSELTATALGELREIAGVKAPPCSVHVTRWERAMAQYAPGHLETVTEIERLRVQCKGLGLAGNFLQGIGVPDCVRTGAQAALALAGSPQPASGV